MGKVKRANAELAKVIREQKEPLRKEKAHHKFMMDGCVAKYYHKTYDLNEQEMNRIIVCAFSLKDVQHMIAIVVKSNWSQKQKT